MSFNPSIVYQSVTIVSGQTQSSSYDTSGATVIGLELPTLTGSSLTFQKLASDGATWLNVLMDDGTAYSVTVSGAGYVSLDPTVMVGVVSLRVVSNSAEGADRAITFVMRVV